MVSEPDIGARTTATSPNYPSGAYSVPPTGSGGSSGGVKDAAKEEAANVAGTAREQAANVAGTAREQAANVAGTVSDQARGLASNVRQKVSSEARTQNDRLADTLRTMAGELEEMASGESSPARSVVSSVAQGTRRAADYVADKGPEGVLSEVTDFARRRPGAFLATAAIAGFVVGRLGKGMMGGSSSSDTPATGLTSEYSPAPYATTPPVDELRSSQVYASSTADRWAAAPGTAAQPTPVVPASTAGPGLVGSSGDVYDPALDAERGIRP